MKKILMALSLLLFSAFAFADSNNQQRWGLAIQNNSGYAKLIPNAQVTLCTYNSDLQCITPVQIYSDSALSNLITYPFYADINGNYSYYTHFGTYVEQVCAPLNQCYTQQVTLVDGGQTAPFLTLQHNEVALTDQTLLNFADDGTIYADVGYTLAKFLTNSSGALSVEYLPNNFDTQVPDPLGTQSVVVYPTAYTTSNACPTQGTIITDPLLPQSAVIQGATLGGLINSQCPTVNWTFAGALPSYVNPANVTAVYPFAVSSMQQLAGTFATILCTVNGSNYGLEPTHSPETVSWILQPVTQSTSGTGAGVDSNTCAASLNATLIGTGTGILNIPAIGFRVYYTGTAPPASTAIPILPPLFLNAQGLGIDPNASFHGLDLQATTIAALPPVPLGKAIRLINNGASSTDCTTGGGANVVECYWNGSAWSAFSSGGGSGISGLTAGFIPLAGSATTLTGNSHIDDGVTTPGALTATEPFAINSPGASQLSLIYNGALVPGSSTTAVYGVDASGNGLLSEAGGAAARICDATNGVCAGSSFITSLTTTGSSGPATVSSGVLNIPIYSGGGGGGTVTSAGLTMPGVLFNASVPGSPITTSGTFAPTLATQTANTGLMGPASGSAATPTFRALVSADLPVGSAAQIGGLECGSGTSCTAGVISATGGSSLFVLPQTYGASGSITTTTGSITSGSNSLTVASASGWSSNMGISVAGAGTSGALLVCPIVTVSGTTFTLFQSNGVTACNAGTTVSGATVNHDDGNAIALAIAQSIAVGQPVYLGPGNYNDAATTFNISAPMMFLGAGTGNTIVWNLSTTQDIFDITYNIAAATEGQGARLQNFAIQQASGVTPTAGNAISIFSATGGNYLSDLVLDNIQIFGTWNGIKVGSGQLSNWFSHIRIQNEVSTGIVYDSPAPSGDDHFESTEMFGANTGLSIGSCDATEFYGLKLNQAGIVFTGTGACGRLRFINMSLEGYGGSVSCGVTFQGTTAVINPQFIGGNIEGLSGNPFCFTTAPTDLAVNMNFTQNGAGLNVPTSQVQQSIITNENSVPATLTSLQTMRSNLSTIQAGSSLENDSASGTSGFNFYNSSAALKGQLIYSNSSAATLPGDFWLEAASGTTLCLASNFTCVITIPSTSAVNVPASIFSVGGSSYNPGASIASFTDNWAFGTNVDLINDSSGGKDWALGSSGSSDNNVGAFSIQDVNGWDLTIVDASSGHPNLLTLARGNFGWSTSTSGQPSSGAAQNAGLSSPSSGNVYIDSTTIGNHLGNVTLGNVLPAAYGQSAASSTGGTCAMSSGTSCTITIGHTYTTPVCIATQQSATLTGTYAGCTVSGTTVTITAGVANSETWGAFVFGNPN